MKIDPANITKFDCSDYELEMSILFWVFAAGNSGKAAARSLNNLIEALTKEYGDLSPFELLRKVDLPTTLKVFGLRFSNNKSKTVKALIDSGICLRTCTCEDLEKIKGIGRKTSRGFIVHSRKDIQCAVLDRHLLKYLKSLGYENIPESTPNNDEYFRVEKIFLSVVPYGFTVSEFDLMIWRIYSGN